MKAGAQTLELYAESEFNVKRVFNISVLTDRNVTFTSSSSLSFRFLGHGLHISSPVRLHFLVQRGSVVEDLPVVRLTDTVGYVTSPWFNGLDRFYPNNYQGKFQLHLSDDQSVFISFLHFLVEISEDCEYDYVDFTVTAVNQTWRKCGYQDIPSRVYRSSVTLFFHADVWGRLTGFKMMYAILPRPQEPQQLSDNLYNCSVPHFHSFKPLLSCNMVTECQGNEDEKDCGYHSNDCGDGATDAGTKCYRFVRRGVTTTWNDAYYECSENNENLVVLATPDEFRRFGMIIASVRTPRRVYRGAKLLPNRKDVNAEVVYRYLWQWVDGRTAFFLNVTGSDFPPNAFITVPPMETCSPSTVKTPWKLTWSVSLTNVIHIQKRKLRFTRLTVYPLILMTRSGK